MSSPNAEALAGLRDIHLPEAVALWPLAPGWWIAIGTLAAAIVGIHLLIRARRRSLKRAALRELDGIAAGVRSQADAAELALRLATLLRRVAIARFPRRDVASLHGAEWSQFLIRTSGDRGVTDRIASDLAVAVYAGPSVGLEPSRVEEWISAARHWIGSNT